MFQNDAKKFITFDDERDARLLRLERDKSGTHSFVLQIGQTDYPFRARIELVGENLIDWKIASFGTAFGPEGIIIGISPDPESYEEAILVDALKAYGGFFGQGPDRVRSVLLPDREGR